MVKVKTLMFISHTIPDPFVFAFWLLSIFRHALREVPMRPKLAALNHGFAAHKMLKHRVTNKKIGEICVYCPPANHYTTCNGYTSVT